ncbi:hypothetical protein [Parasitella parasitica]|uniref:Uncharacterized protein n=1 Tax=Parasitella parasitica TaxID=35722 RepID=A0A0B7N3C3_9FUNG|nr:hypothetical protein [Parasitella parasitica]
MAATTLSPSINLSSNMNTNDLTSIQNSLIESFGQICSVEQMELCQKLGMLSKSEQQQAYKMAKALIENRQMPVSMEDWNNLTEWVLMLRDRYAVHLESQCIRQHANDLERIEFLDQVQRLSSLLEEYGQAHDDLTDLLQALKKLRNDWKHRKRDVENIVLSILSSSSNPHPEYRIVKITRTHLATLGLGFSSIGKHYIVYESSMSDESKKDILNNVARDFGMVFQENAAQNLARMAGSYHRIFQKEEDVDVLDEIQKLAQQVYITRPRSVILPYPTSLPTSAAAGTTTAADAATAKRNSTFLERRKSVIILESEDNSNDSLANENGEQYQDNTIRSPMVFNMAKPIFEPAGWDWPHLLKYKRSRTRSGNRSGSYYWCTQILSPNTTGEKDAISAPQGIWSTSISRLSDHFAKVGQDYYSNMLNNARLMHSHRAQMFEFATHSLMKTYRALQLEQGCANLSRTLVFLYRLQQETPQRI